MTTNGFTKICLYTSQKISCETDWGSVAAIVTSPLLFNCHVVSVWWTACFMA